MCGIFFYLGQPITDELRTVLETNLKKTQHRGPDDTCYSVLNNIFFGFHRLSINDTSTKGNQPFNIDSHKDITLICNGEIYNAQKIKDEHNFKTYSDSDCEVIIHLYRLYGITKTVKMLDGVFAFVLHDNSNKVTYIARDPIGVRSLYYGSSDNEFFLSSELKSIHELSNKVKPFPPGSIAELLHEDGIVTYSFDKYYDYDYKLMPDLDESEYMKNIKLLLEEGVNKRLMSDRPIGCLLSGGLDSSLITALVAKHFEKGKLNTFSVGLEGAPDLIYARKVAEHLGTNHHEVVLTEEQMLGCIDEDIKQIETYDTTTVRASTPMFLLSKYIKENTDITVVYSGEGSDEASGSYMYFHNAPDEESFKNETFRLMRDLNRFDVLRCDKSTAGAGLEVRVPFLDKRFLHYYMSIPPKFKMAGGRIEKYLLRKSFDDGELLPYDVLWRSKEGMSDGVSSKTKSWYEIIGEKASSLYSDEDLENAKTKYTHNPPRSKESLYFREIFNKHYPERDGLIPYYWLPKWSGDTVEPSARTLNVYKD